MSEEPGNGQARKKLDLLMDKIENIRVDAAETKTIVQMLKHDLGSHLSWSEAKAVEIETRVRMVELRQERTSTIIIMVAVIVPPIAGFAAWLVNLLLGKVT